MKVFIVMSMDIMILQDRLSFPLDRTTAECMENHLIHLPSGRTIEAVGTIDI